MLKMVRFCSEIDLSDHDCALLPAKAPPFTERMSFKRLERRGSWNSLKLLYCHNFTDTYAI